jgi:hypothetical protein
MTGMCIFPESDPDNSVAIKRTFRLMNRTASVIYTVDSCMHQTIVFITLIIARSLLVDTFS